MGAEERYQLTNARVDVGVIAQRTRVNTWRVATGKVHAVPARRGLCLMWPTLRNTGCSLPGQSCIHGRLLEQRVTMRSVWSCIQLRGVHTRKRLPSGGGLHTVDGVRPDESAVPCVLQTVSTAPGETMAVSEFFRSRNSDLS